MGLGLRRETRSVAGSMFLGCRCGASARAVQICHTGRWNFLGKSTTPSRAVAAAGRDGCNRGVVGAAERKMGRGREHRWPAGGQRKRREGKGEGGGRKRKGAAASRRWENEWPSLSTAGHVLVPGTRDSGQSRHSTGDNYPYPPHFTQCRFFSRHNLPLSPHSSPLGAQRTQHPPSPLKPSQEASDTSLLSTRFLGITTPTPSSRNRSGTRWYNSASSAARSFFLFSSAGFPCPLCQYPLP